MINMKNKRGQFYLVATIIIVALVVSITVIFNHSTRTNYYDVEKVTKELGIEGERVLDYDSVHLTNEFDNDFSKVYSSYAGEDKDIYFIIVDESNGIQEAYKYTQGQKVSLNDHLNVEGNNIQFTLDTIYTFKLEQGKNFYFLVIYDKGGERYVYTG